MPKETPQLAIHIEVSDTLTGHQYRVVGTTVYVSQESYDIMATRGWEKVRHEVESALEEKLKEMEA